MQWKASIGRIILIWVPGITEQREYENSIETNPRNSLHWNPIMKLKKPKERDKDRDHLKMEQKENTLSPLIIMMPSSRYYRMRKKCFSAAGKMCTKTSSLPNNDQLTHLKKHLKKNHIIFHLLCFMINYIFFILCSTQCVIFYSILV